MFRLAAAWLAKKRPSQSSPASKRVRVVATAARKKAKLPLKKTLPLRTRSPATRPKTKAKTTTTEALPSGVCVDNAVAVQAAEKATAPTPAVVDAGEKKPHYCLATAVSTIIVPPVANYFLEGMKQTLTPSAQRPNDGGSGIHNGGGTGASSEDSREPVSQMEEFYTFKKGPLFATAVIAGTNAVKQASQLIPFCHPVRIQKCSFTFRRRVVAGLSRSSALPHRVVLRKRASPPPPPSRARGECSVLYCFCTVASEDSRAGVEMEALTGANVASLTLYDMLRSLPGSQEDGLGIGESFVLAKRGGKSDFTKLLVSETEATPPPPPQSLAAPSPLSPSALEGGETTAPPSAPPAADVRVDGDSGGERREGEGGGGNGDAGGEQHSPPQQGDDAGREEMTNAAAGDSAGDRSAWWKSTPRERKLQQLHPRRKLEKNNDSPATATATNSSRGAAVPKKTLHAKMSGVKGDRGSRKINLKQSAKVAKEDTRRVDATPAKRRASRSLQTDDDDLTVEEEDVDVSSTSKKMRRVTSALAGTKHTSSSSQRVVSQDVVDLDTDDEDVDAEEHDEDDEGISDDASDGENDVAPVVQRGRRRMQQKDEEAEDAHVDIDNDGDDTGHEEEGEENEDVYEESLARRVGTTRENRRTSPVLASRRAKSREIAMPVKHDSWDNETEIEGDYDQNEDGMLDYLEEEEEEKKKKKKSSSPPHRNKKAAKPSRVRRPVARR